MSQGVGEVGASLTPVPDTFPALLIYKKHAQSATITLECQGLVGCVVGLQNSGVHQPYP